MENIKAYDRTTVIKALFVFALMIVAMQFGRGLGFVIFIPLILSAILQNKTDKLLLYMVVTIAALVGNGHLMPKSTGFNVLHKILMTLMAVTLSSKLAGHKHSPILTPMMGMFAYLLVACLSSANGWNPLISYLKLFLFGVIYFAYYGFANTVISSSRVDIRFVRGIYLAFSCFFIFGSVALIPFPQISQLAPELAMDMLKRGIVMKSLFCGMTFHSQSLGPIIAIISTLLLSDLFFSVKKVDRLILGLLACCPILIFKTSSRTAMGTFIAGALFVLYLFMQGRNISSRWKGKVISCSLILLIFASISLLASSSGRDAVAKFVLKSSEDRTFDEMTMEGLMSSRQGLMDDAMMSFKESPFIGNGFQVSKQLIGAGKDGWTSLLSAPVEKGVWLTAVLEETGALGFFVFIVFIVSAFANLIKRKGYCTVSVLFTILVSNLGEFSMFSMSGVGGFYWCLLFVGAVLDAKRLQEEKQISLSDGFGRW